MTSSSPASSVLPGDKDKYNCITLNEPQLRGLPVGDYEAKLKTSLTQWASEGVTGVWLNCTKETMRLIDPSIRQGFLFHRARLHTASLYIWLPDTALWSKQDHPPFAIPEYATTSMGVGCVVINKAGKVLMVNEAGRGWGLPGGSVELGEDIPTAGAREVFEETGIKCKFESILGFRHKQNFRFGIADMYVLAVMRSDATEADIKVDNREVQQGRWATLEEAIQLKFDPSSWSFPLVSGLRREHARIASGAAAGKPDAPGPTAYESMADGAIRVIAWDKQKDPKGGSLSYTACVPDPVAAAPKPTQAPAASEAKISSSSSQPSATPAPQPSPSTAPAPSPAQTLPGDKDKYNCVTITEAAIRSLSIQELEQQLASSLKQWAADGVTGVWLNCTADTAKFLASALGLGFQFHRARGSAASIYIWLPDTALWSKQDHPPFAIPEYATTSMGVGCVVINKAGKVLMVNEAGRGWGLPGGSVELGEDIPTAGAREVFEETGIKCKFESVLGFRHKQNFRFGIADMYVLAVMRSDATEADIKVDNREVQQGRWATLEEAIQLKFDPSSWSFPLVSGLRREHARIASGAAAGKPDAPGPTAYESMADGAIRVIAWDKQKDPKGGSLSYTACVPEVKVAAPAAQAQAVPAVSAAQSAQPAAPSPAPATPAASAAGGKKNKKKNKKKAQK